MLFDDPSDTWRFARPRVVVLSLCLAPKESYKHLAVAPRFKQPSALHLSPFNDADKWPSRRSWDRSPQPCEMLAWLLRSRSSPTPNSAKIKRYIASLLYKRDVGYLGGWAGTAV